MTRRIEWDGGETASPAWLLENEQAFVDLVSRHHSEVLGFVLAFARVAETARTLAAEIWRDVLVHLPDVDRASSLRVSILRIAAARTSASAAADGGAEHACGTETDRFTADGRWRTPPRAWSSAMLASIDAQAAVSEGLRDLPRRVRAVLQLRDVQGLSLAETADVLRVSTDEARVLLHRGRAALRRAVEACVDANESATAPVRS